MHIARNFSNLLEVFTHGFAQWAGSSWGFVTAMAAIIAWLFCGQFFHFSLAWEDSLSVGVAIFTFLMIFLMQRSQRKELLALHVKLNELIAVTKGANNHLISIEKQTEEEIAQVRDSHESEVDRGRGAE